MKPVILRKSDLIELINQLPERVAFATKVVETQMGKSDAYYLSITSIPQREDIKLDEVRIDG